MRVEFVLHADFERPGALATWAKDQEFKTRYWRPFAGELAPDVGRFDILILMGGPQSPLEMQEAPYLQDEIELIKEAVFARKLVVGFCLGAQLIGEAFGARTERSPHKEIGVFPITLTGEGQKDPMLEGLPHEFPVVHWHNDMPGVPYEADILATSAGCPRQIIRYNYRTYGFQCHPEPGLEDIKGMIQHCGHELQPGPYVQSAEELLSANYAQINRFVPLMMENLLQRSVVRK